MRKKTVLEKWISWNNENQIIAYLVLFLLGVSIVLSDWTYGYFTFTEYIMIPSLFLLFIVGQLKVTRIQLKIGIVLALFLVVHMIGNNYSNSEFDLRTGIIACIKLSFYIIALSGFYNFIKKNEFSALFLKWNNILAIATVLIGIYITIALYSNGSLPYRFFWEYTRWDIYSYYFEANPNIIRTKSIFAEPAHLGYYLNAILLVNLFNVKKLRASKFFYCLISLGVILTFSYSMIAILIAIFTCFIISQMKRETFQWKNRYLIIITLFVSLIIYLWDTIYITLIQRTVAIISGQDTSALMRLVESWEYISWDHIWIGNGIGHTPPITNVVAYMLSDLGIVGLVIFGGLNLYILFNNGYIGMIFILLSFSKGGYLSSGFWTVLLLIFLYTINSSSTENKVVFKN